MRARAWLMEPHGGRRPGRAGRRGGQHLRPVGGRGAGRARGRHRLPHRRHPATRAASTGWSACSAAWRRSARCGRRRPPAPLHRADHVHRRGAHALRLRVPGQPGAGRGRRRRAARPPARRRRHVAGRGPRRSRHLGRRGRGPPGAGAYAAFVELHIEQGPDLERTGVPIGVVTAIAAPATLRVELSGDGGHAGAVLDGPPPRPAGGGGRGDPGGRDRAARPAGRGHGRHGRRR